MADLLLLLHVNFIVAHQHDRPVGPDVLLASAELPGCHVPLHDVHTVLLVEGDAGDLVEADDVVLGDEPALASCIVDEHLRHARLATGNEVRVGGDLLEQVALAGAPGSKFHHVEVPFDERDHAQQRNQPATFTEGLRFEPDRPQQELDPLLRGEQLSPLGERRQRIRRMHLDRPERLDCKRAPTRLLRHDRVIGHRCLGVEPSRQQPFVVVDHIIRNAGILEEQAWQFRDVAVVLGVKACPDNVDHPHAATLACPGQEQLLLPGSHRPLGQLLLDNAQTILDLRFIDARAVAPQHELHDVGGDRKLLGVLSHQVLADEVAVECARPQLVKVVKCECHQAPPTVVAARASTFPVGSRTTTVIAFPSWSSLTATRQLPLTPTGWGATAMVEASSRHDRRSATRTV